MKVLFIGSDPSLFTERSSARLRMKAYAEAIGILHIACPIARSAQPIRVHDGSLTLHGVPSVRLLRIPMLACAAREIIRQERIEIVSAQDPFEYGLAALRAAHGTSARVHIQVHTDLLSPWFARGHARAALYNRIRQQVSRYVLPRAQGIRTVSCRVRDSLERAYAGRLATISVLPIESPDPLSLPAPLLKLPFPFVIMAIGRLEPEKRFQDLVSAMAEVCAVNPEAGLVILGEGRERASLEAEIARRNLAAHVVLLGAQADASTLIGQADIFLQASAYEGYGLTLLEAAQAGLPIITTDVGIVGDVLLDGESASVVPIGNPPAIAERITALIKDPELRERLGGNARSAARRHREYSQTGPEAIADDLKRMLD